LDKLQNNNTQVQKANKATAPMYISNPFYKKGLSVNDLFSTHPPLGERIRILRTMSGAGYADYEKSYEQVVKGGKSYLAPLVCLPNLYRAPGYLRDSRR